MQVFSGKTNVFLAGTETADENRQFFGIFYQNETG